MRHCPVDEKECNCAAPCAALEMRLIWSHENDDTLDEWGIFFRGERIAKYEGENQAMMAFEDMLSRGQSVRDR